MKNHIYIYLVFLTSCSSLNSQHNEVSRIENGKPISVSSDTIFVELTPKIAFHWNNRTSSIIEDGLYEISKNSYLHEKDVIINQISNVKETHATMCDVERGLVIGDLAYLMVDRFDRIPWASVFKAQFDYSSLGCDYPIGLIDYIKDNRDEAITRIQEYIK